jgi:NADH:ubiquinone reductase (H+-translocating)
VNQDDARKSTARPRVVIIGAGFGGLACARELGGSAVDVTVVDRRNHNLFQPLLYQVATAALSPADVAEPIRKTLGRYENIRVLLGEVTGVDGPNYAVKLGDGRVLAFDYLVLATGSEYNYFGHEDWQQWAPGLKTIHEARIIRQRLLLAFERAEAAENDIEKTQFLTSVIVGGGPTGVEMAGAISELGRYMIARDFRALKPHHMRVILVEAGERLLGAFPEDLADYATAYLRKIEVEIRLDQRVTAISNGSVTIGDEVIRTGCIIWGAGVKPSPAAQWLARPGVGGRIPVDEFLAVAGLPRVFAIGDTAYAVGTDGRPLPALAQVAKQQGVYLGRSIRERILNGASTRPFVFHNRGNTAVIGRNAAVFDFGKKRRMKGRLAWLLWAFIHVYLLVNFEKRLLVSIQWLWRYFTRQRGARIIDETSLETQPLHRNGSI